MLRWPKVCNLLRVRAQHHVRPLGLYCCCQGGGGRRNCVSNDSGFPASSVSCQAMSKYQYTCTAYSLVLMSALFAQAIKEGYEVVVCDTSGRLHTNAGLMDELAKCKRAIGKRLAQAPHETLLVLDGTTGGSLSCFLLLCTHYWWRCSACKLVITAVHCGRCQFLTCQCTSAICC